MAEQDKISDDFRDLITTALNEDLAEAELARLNITLEQDAAARAYYLQVIHLHAGLKQVVGNKYLDHLLPEMDIDDEKIFREIIEQDLNDSAVLRALEGANKKKQKSRDGFSDYFTVNRPYKPTRRDIMSFLLKVAAVFLISFSVIWLDRMLYERVNQPIQAQYVADIVDEIGSRWSSATEYTAAGRDRKLYQGQMKLLSGYVRIRFAEGAEIILAAPAEVELIDEKTIFLRNGTLTCYVPQRAIGFTVRSYNTSIMDLGTEFGVEVNASNSCELHVFQGKASLITGPFSRKKQSRILTRDQAVRVDYSSGKINNISLQKRKFVRAINSQDKVLWRGETFNLADVVGGGNGFGTGRLDYGINPLTGEYSKLNCVDRLGSGMYISVPQNQFIDGVFVPNGDWGPIRISSEGHLFYNCPETNNIFYTEIINGTRLRIAGGIKDGVWLNNLQYGIPQRPAIFMHANLGITFDLDSIRRALPEVDITRFTALGGISQVVPPKKANADFWVLVDGEIRFRKRHVRLETGIFVIRVELKPQDRFLTLVTTDGGDPDIARPNRYDRSTNMDYCVFGKPFLELKHK